MTYPGYRSGTTVSYRGRERPATYRYQTGEVIFFSRAPENPDPELYEWDEQRQGWIALLNASDCDRVFSVNPFAWYLGNLCEVTAMNEDGTAELRYADWNGSWAVANGFEQRNKLEYYKVVPVNELYDYHEKQRDLVFDEWRTRNFARSAEVLS
jgi:hypothetical protein